MTIVSYFHYGCSSSVSTFLGEGYSFCLESHPAHSSLHVASVAGPAAVWKVSSGRVHSSKISSYPGDPNSPRTPRQVLTLTCQGPGSHFWFASQLCPSRAALRMARSGLWSPRSSVPYLKPVESPSPAARLCFWSQRSRNLTLIGRLIIPFLRPRRAHVSPGRAQPGKGALIHRQGRAS